MICPVEPVTLSMTSSEVPCTGLFIRHSHYPPLFTPRNCKPLDRQSDLTLHPFLESVRTLVDGGPLKITNTGPFPTEKTNKIW